MQDVLLSKSYSDFIAATILIKEHSNYPKCVAWFDIVLYQMQQAFEKALRSYIKQHDVVPEKTQGMWDLYLTASSLGLSFQPSSIVMFEELADWEAVAGDDNSYNRNDTVIENYLSDYVVLHQEVLSFVGNGSYEDNVKSLLKYLGREDVDVNTVMSYLPTFPLEGVVLEGAIKEVVRILDGDKA